MHLRCPPPRSIINTNGSNIPSPDPYPLHPIPPAIIPPKPRPEPQHQNYAHPLKRRRDNQRGDILRRRLGRKGERADDAARVTRADHEARDGRAPVLRGRVVVVPAVEDAGRGEGARGEQEARKVRRAGLGLRVEGDEEDETDKGQQHGSGEMRGPFPEMVG